MTKILAATLLATALALPGTAFADGCVEDYVLTSDDTLLDYPLVTLNPDGSVTAYPNNVVPNAVSLAAWASRFADCVV